MFANLNSLFFLNKWKKKRTSVQQNILSSNDEVSYHLKQLQKELVIMTAKFPSDPDIYNTAIIHVDDKKKLFHLDELVPHTGNSQIKKHQKVFLRTRLDGTILSMNCSLKEAVTEQHIAHYIMHFPLQIKSTQRRNSFRINIPITTRFQVNMQTESGHYISAFLNNISISGAAFRLEKHQMIQLNKNETIPFLTLHLDQAVTCKMIIKRVFSIQGSTIISGQFEEISSTHRQQVQRFVTRLDRERRQQEAS